MPRKLNTFAYTHEKISLTWLSPLKPNGPIIEYIITITKLEEMLDDEKMDICSSSVGKRGDMTNKITSSEPQKSIMMLDHNTSNNTSNEPSSPNNCDPKPSTSNTEIQEEVVTFQDDIIETIYLKQNICNNTKPTRRKRAISIQPPTPNKEALSENNRVTLTKQSSNSDKIDSVKQNSTVPKIREYKYDSTSNSMMIRVPSYVTKKVKTDSYTIMIDNLEHYTLYSIEVVACHSNSTDTQVKTSKDYKLCSLEALSTIRTLPIEENDNVDPRFIRFYPANETSNHNILMWGKPQKPNGPIFGYYLQIATTNDSPRYTRDGCVTNSEMENGFKLVNQYPGHYRIRVKAVSLYSLYKGIPLEFNGEPIDIVIPSDSFASPFTISMIAVFCLAFMATIAYTTCYFQKQKTAANGLLYASVNPDYIRKYFFNQTISIVF